MRALELDFQRPPRPSRYGWAILVAGLATMAALLATHRMLMDEAGARLAAVKRIEARLPDSGTVRTQNPKDEAALTAARQTVERAKLPWNSLFSALESADNKDVALLAVTPDVARGQVKIHAEARDLAAMLAYHRRLQQGAGVHQVTLVDHEVSKESAETPVRFHLIATWGADHGRP